MSIRYKDSKGNITMVSNTINSDTLNTFDPDSEDAISGKAVAEALKTKQDILIPGKYIKIVKAGVSEKTAETAVYPITFTGEGSNLSDYKIYGNIKQTSTPSPTNPVDVSGVGKNFTIKNGSIEKTVYLDSPLYKIDEYTDCLNYSLKQIKRYTKKVNLLDLEWKANATNGKYRFYATPGDYAPNTAAGRASNVYFNRFYFASNGDTYGLGFGHSNKNIYIYVSAEVTNVDELKAWLRENDSYMVYPVETGYVESIDSLPAIPTVDGNNSITVISDAEPSKIGITYAQKGDSDEAGYVISCDGLEDLINKLIDERLGG